MNKEKSIIYIVEDDTIYANIIIKVLSKEFIEFKHFTNGKEMLEAITVKKPDICILDFNLDKSENDNLKMNGLQIMQLMKNKNIDVPIIMLSGIEDVQMAIDTLKFNASDYVVKNENAVVRLEKVINKILDLKWNKKQSTSHLLKSKRLRKQITLTLSIVAILLFVIVKFL